MASKVKRGNCWFLSYKDAALVLLLAGCGKDAAPSPPAACPACPPATTNSGAQSTDAHEPELTFCCHRRVDSEHETIYVRQASYCVAVSTPDCGSGEGMRVAKFGERYVQLVAKPISTKHVFCWGFVTPKTSKADARREVRAALMNGTPQRFYCSETWEECQRRRAHGVNFGNLLNPDSTPYVNSAFTQTECELF